MLRGVFARGLPRSRFFGGERGIHPDAAHLADLIVEPWMSDEYAASL